MERVLDRRLRLRDQHERKISHVSNRKGHKVECDRIIGRSKDEFIYCMAFNRGDCPEANTHKGKSEGREGVTFNHACRKCLQERGLRVGHAKIDDKCPFNANRK